MSPFTPLLAPPRRQCRVVHRDHIETLTHPIHPIHTHTAHTEASPYGILTATGTVPGTVPGPVPGPICWGKAPSL